MYFFGLFCRICGHITTVQQAGYIYIQAHYKSFIWINWRTEVATLSSSLIFFINNCSLVRVRKPKQHQRPLETMVDTNQANLSYVPRPQNRLRKELIKVKACCKIIQRHLVFPLYSYLLYGLSLQATFSVPLKWEVIQTWKLGTE